MSHKSKWVGVATTAWALSLATSCASAPPKELENARTAVQEARAGLAKDLNPAQLHVAEKSLQLAEATYEAEGDSASTRDRAYVAMRKAQLAQVQASIADKENRLRDLEQQAASNRTEKLAELRDEYAEQRVDLASVERARKAAEQRAKQLSQDLAQVAQVREEARGTVLTLSGSLLFASGEAELLPAAQARLSRVAQALSQQAKGALIVVEGHTDTQGSEELNLELSERRATVVKKYLSAHGVAEDRIEAKGVGFRQPIAPNETAEGRAQNRRVEIVLEPATNTSSQPNQTPRESQGNTSG